MSSPGKEVPEDFAAPARGGRPLPPGRRAAPVFAPALAGFAPRSGRRAAPVFAPAPVGFAPHSGRRAPPLAPHPFAAPAPASASAPHAVPGTAAGRARVAEDKERAQRSLERFLASTHRVYHSTMMMMMMMKMKCNRICIGFRQVCNGVQRSIDRWIDSIMECLFVLPQSQSRFREFVAVFKTNRH